MKGNLDDLRILNRAGDLMDREGRPRAPLEAEINKPAIGRRMRGQTGADPDLVVPGREIAGKLDEEGSIQTAVDIVNCEVSPRVQRRLLQVVPPVGKLNGPDSEGAVRMICIILAGVETEGLRGRRARDLRPRATEKSVVFRGLAQRIHDLRILRPARSFLHRLYPRRRPLMGIPVGGIMIRDGFDRGFRFKAELLFHAKSRMKRSSFLQRFPGDRLVLLKLVAGHEKTGPNRVEARGIRVRRQITDIHVGP